MIRDVSPAVGYVAPGTATFGMALQLSDHGSENLALDLWLNSFSPSYDVTMDLTSGFNAITVPDTTHSRLFVMIPPRGNTTTITLQGLVGDTGLSVHPNTPIVLGISDTTPPASIGVTVGSGIVGVRVLFI